MTSSIRRFGGKTTWSNGCLNALRHFRYVICCGNIPLPNDWLNAAPNLTFLIFGDNVVFVRDWLKESLK